MIKFLDVQKIQVNTKRKIDILTQPFGEKIINILRYLAMELDSPYSGDELLFEIMHYDFSASLLLKLPKQAWLYLKKTLVRWPTISLKHPFADM